MELTILMPCLNESLTLLNCINKAKKFIDESKIEANILIADNGSTDGSQKIATDNGAKVVDVKERGYGAALIAGIKAADGKYVIMGDSDESYDFENLQPFIDELRKDNHLVMGNRFAGGVEPKAMPFLNKYLGNPVLSFFGRLFFKTPIGDFHCGLRGFNRERMLDIELKSPGMEFASEMVIKSVLNDLKISEVPIKLYPDGRDRPPHLRRWRDGWRHLVLLLLFSPRWLFLYPGLLLTSLGIILMGLLTAGPIQAGEHFFDINTLLYSGALVVAGFQVVSFAIFSKLIAAIKLALPIKGSLERVLSSFTLEKGITLGLVFILLSIIGTTMSLHDWSLTGFGDLMPKKIMRLTIPSVVAFILGIQTLFSSFFLKLLLTDEEGNILK